MQQQQQGQAKPANQQTDPAVMKAAMNKVDPAKKKKLLDAQKTQQANPGLTLDKAVQADALANQLNQQT